MTAVTRTHIAERPATVTELAEILRGSAGSVLVRGGGTSLDWAGRVPDPDLVLDTTGLAGVLTHNPGDMTASARAGTTLTALQEQLAGSGQWLALDPPTADAGATLGGLLATGDSGPSRLRYGGLRDHVIGVTLVLADGTVARSGGHVIKNVAGYDLAKLVHGSLGALAVVAEVVLRLHPRPATSRTISGPAGAEQATAAALALAASPLEPAAVEWISGEPGTLLVRVDGTPGPVAASGARIVDLLVRRGIDAVAMPDADATAAWAALAAGVRGEPGETVARVAGRPGDLAALAGHLSGAADAAGVGMQLLSSAGLGLHTARLHGGTAAAHVRVLAALRQHARSTGASVLLRSRTPELDDMVDALGPPPSTAALLRSVKAQFDPDGRLAPGRFQPWF